MVDYEYNSHDNVGYMVMELGNGSLRQYLQGSPLNDQTRRMFWKQIVGILRALEDAHIGRNSFPFISISLLIFTVHADIKPDNMILVGNVLKITDLGLAFGSSSSRQLVRRSAVRGTIGMFTLTLHSHSHEYISDRLHGTGSLFTTNRF